MTALAIEHMTNELDIIEAVLAGRTESFRLLVERYERPVVSMVRNMTGDPQTAEDVAQEVFLTAFAKLRTFDPARSRFSTWLFTIARNKSVNALKKRRPRLFGRPPERADSCEPGEGMERREAMAMLDSALAALPAKQRRAFVLVEFEGLSYEETAQIEATRIGTIKSRVSRARAALAQALKGYDGDRP